MTLWVYTDGTEYSLPIYVTDTATEMAKLTNRKPQSVLKAWFNYKHGITPRTRFEKVEVEKEKGEW